jgi:hypothetical protein
LKKGLFLSHSSSPPDAQLAQRGRGVYEKVTVETIVRVTVERVLAAGGHHAMDVTA